MQKTLLCLGIGYSAQALAELLAPRGWKIMGTTRDALIAEALHEKGYEIFAPDSIPERAFNEVTHMLHSIPPAKEGDRVLAQYRKQIETADLEWLGYLSTTGVYGHHNGAWVDETTSINPVTDRQQRRAETEVAFLKLKNVPSHVFRLAGIYGPGRSVIDDIQAGQARRIDKPGQVFSRIHVEDIARTLRASIESPSPGETYNVCDDEPCPAHEVVTYACEKMNVTSPPLIPFEQAELSEMGKEFYSSNRRVSNAKIRGKLGVQLLYPTYREGINALLSANYSG